jgi:hypothetical protein
LGAFVQDTFDDAFTKLLTHKEFSILAIGQFAMLGAWAHTYARSNYSWAIGGNGIYSTCPVLRVAHHVPYARADWQKLPKLHHTYFEEAQRVVFEGECWSKTACKQPMPDACTSVIRNGSHYSLLSLEADFEMMFGGAGRPLAKPDCTVELAQQFNAYERCLAKRCAATT